MKSDLQPSFTNFLQITAPTRNYKYGLDGQMKYPESSQRTAVDGDTRSCRTHDTVEDLANTCEPSKTLDSDKSSNINEGAPFIPASQTALDDLYFHPRPSVVNNLFAEAKSHSSKDYDSGVQSGSATETYLSSGTHNYHPSLPLSSDMDWSETPLQFNYDQDQPFKFRTPTSVIHTPSSNQPTSGEGVYDTALHIPLSLTDDRLPKKKKSKMHQCEICKKLFPRPSGLKTHMNAHNNLKPFPCSFKGCKRTFTVRSNAKRHLRTHGVEVITPRNTPPAPYSVGFEPPSVLLPPAAAHEMAKPYKLRWVPPSLTTRTNAATLVPLSDDETSDDEYMNSAVDVPLPSVVPSSLDDDPDKPLEERNSYIEAPAYPYHSTQFLALPGPAPLPPLSASTA